MKKKEEKKYIMGNSGSWTERRKIIIIISNRDNWTEISKELQIKSCGLKWKNNLLKLR